MAKTTALEAKAYRLRTAYKLTIEQHEQMLKDQNYQCGNCNRKFKPVGTFMAFHDHDGKCCARRLKRYCGLCNRALLCYVCNAKVVGHIEAWLKQGEDVIGSVNYINKWNNILKERGAYAPKPEVKKTKRVRKSKKSVR